MVQREAAEGRPAAQSAVPATRPAAIAVDAGAAAAAAMVAAAAADPTVAASALAAHGTPSAAPLAADPAGAAAAGRPAASALGSPGDAQGTALAARLAEQFGRDVVYRYRLAPDRGFDYVSPSCLALTGLPPAAFIADPRLLARLVHPADAALVDPETGRPLSPDRMIRLVRRDGAVRWVTHHVVIVADPAGRPIAFEGIVRDETESVAAREAIVARDQGTWAFLAAAADPAIALDAHGRIVFANARLLDLVGHAAGEVVGREWVALQHPDDVIAGRSLTAAPPAGWTAGREVTAPVLLRDGRTHSVRWVALPVPGVAGQAGSTAFLGTDLTAEQERVARVAELLAAVEHATDAVMMTDLSGRILYVNPTFEAATGYPAAEVLGQNPRILKSGVHDDETYASLWWTITHGQVWKGELVNQRADGGTMTVDATIVPVRDSRGVPVAYVAVQHDVGLVRDLRSRIEDTRKQRERLAGSLERLALKDSVEASCQGIATVLADLPGVLAGAIAVVDDAPAMRLAAMASRVLERSARWLEPTRDLAARICAPDAAPFVEPVARMDPVRSGALKAAGIHAVLYVPVRQDSNPLGALVVGGADGDGADVRGQILGLWEVAAVLRAVLGPQASPHHERMELRARTRELMAEGASHPVFQPIRDMITGRIAGLEALTRFADGTAPDVAFVDAARCGLGLELELATLRASVRAASALPKGAWLSLNVSAALITAGGEIAQLLRAARREVVVEITLGGEGTDYVSARRALEAIGDHIRIAVDDAGTGSDFRHLVELRPHLVKIGPALVRGIERDPARQAMVAGLKQFAVSSGGGLIAEGIETAAEQATLVKLGVPFGQGYHLGRPDRAEAWTAHRA